MTNEQLNQFANNIFPVMAQFIDGEPTMEKIEAAFHAAIARRDELKFTYLEDKEFRTSVHDMLFEGALEKVA